MCFNVKRFFDKCLAPPNSYSTSFSHSVLAASALWALVQYYGGEDDFKFGYAGLGLILLQGVSGMWRFASPSSSSSWVRFYELASFAATVYSLPLILVDLYLDYGFCYEICYFHLCYPIVILIPIVAAKDKRMSKEIIDMVVFISEISLCLISILQESKYCGLAAGLIHMFTHFVITQKGRTMNIPSLDFYNYGLCAFLFFVLHSLLCGAMYWCAHHACVKTVPPSAYGLSNNCGPCAGQNF